MIWYVGCFQEEKVYRHSLTQNHDSRKRKEVMGRYNENVGNTEGCPVTDGRKKEGKSLDLQPACD